MREGVQRAIHSRKASPLERHRRPGAREELEVECHLLEGELYTRGLRGTAEGEEGEHELRATGHAERSRELVFARPHVAVHAVLQAPELQRHLLNASRLEMGKQ